jgi:hypothetical protein
MQITSHSRKRKSPSPIVIRSELPWRKIERWLAGFFRAQGGQLECDGDVYLWIAAKDSGATGLEECDTCLISAEDVLLVSLTEVAQQLAQELAEVGAP